jgi:predicted MFS family arabinose efflux permease
VCAESSLVKSAGSATGGLTRRVVVAVLARLVINIGHRIAYPFLPVIARGLGIPMGSAGILITLLLATGMLSPIFGPMSDRFGRRRGMVLGMLLVAAGAACVALIPRFPAVSIGFALMGLGKVAFDPSLRAYLGDSLPYDRRGRVLAITELSWAGALLIGAPLAGWIIEKRGWRSPFVFVAGMALAGAVGIALVMPGGRPSAESGHRAVALRTAFRSVLRNRSAVAALGVTWLIMVAHELLFVVYGTWMESSFGLSVGRLGLTTVVIGVAELMGELVASAWVDRMGKRRAIGVGLVFTAVTYVVWPLAPGNLGLVLVCLFALLFWFEFTFVATLPLVTELVPRARATAVALNGAIDGLGRSVGALLALPLWSAVGLVGNGVAAAVTTLIAAGILYAFVQVDPAAGSENGREIELGKSDSVFVDSD